MRASPLLIALLAGPVAAQADAPAPLTRAQAVAQAVEAGTRARLAGTDTAVANALAAVAAAYPNPSLSASYSKSLPQYHLSIDQPIEYPWMRSARQDAASEFRRAALFRYELERAAIAVEADTLYTAALAAQAHARLAHATAAAADSLLAIARLRRDAGDASELEVELAAVTAGEAANASVTDSLAAVAALLDLQRAIGLSGDRALIAPADSLDAPLPEVPLSPPGGDSTLAPLVIAEARANVRAAQHVLAVESRSTFATPSVFVGVDAGDSTQPGILPTFGLSLPIPLWNARSGEVAAARAGLDRAQAEYARTRRENAAAVARARRELDAARTRVARDERLLASARRVAQMSLTAYAEGAAGLPAVLEAQRAARDAFGRWMDDLAAARNAQSLLVLHTLSARIP